MSRAPDVRPLDVDAGPESVEEIELGLLLEALWRCSGFDFREYARTSLRRRIRHFMDDEGLETISALQARVLHERGWVPRLVHALTVNVTAMFRDPGLYRTLREVVVPVLRTYPVIRIWHAGCSTGEEVYSLAILLHEEGLQARCRIYATDMNEAVLRRARLGVLPLAGMRENTRNYMAAGGRSPFARWYTGGPEGAVLSPALRENVIFAPHNLVTDGSFNEFNLVLCRNVIIYFNRALQDRVHDLLHASLSRFGYLALGARETVRFTAVESRYRELSHHVFRKVA